ncbi:hypothetical protein ES319_D11G007500v1 [Gossypium barbadense]|uniref:Uncharacterized protein n=2 Tax=Gossypium TaxID=3633 RepID=A0A5J5P643_GOSBA|nr:hypothetical protein ES319_D11G007500v1 [Gossypium barbadense]TYG43345.1 hypothetical protein ES288_D11G009100v1 [Gossypium darwinii]
MIPTIRSLTQAFNQLQHVACLLRSHQLSRHRRNVFYPKGQKNRKSEAVWKYLEGGYPKCHWPCLSAAQLSMMFKDKRWQVVRIESDQSSDHQTYNSGSSSEEDECKWEAEKRWCNN